MFVPTLLLILLRTLPPILPIVLLVPASSEGASLTASVDGLSRIEGDAVYGGGEEGVFFAVARRARAEADPDRWRTWARDVRPVVRALGLLVLASELDREALPELSAALTDEAGVEMFPGGCTGWTTTVADFARRLIRNSRFLEMGADPRPLLEATEQQALDVAMLARNECAALHGELSRLVARAAAGDGLSFNGDAFARVAPGLGPVDFVRGVGRIAACDVRTEFLVHTLERPGATSLERLAAASALTRDPTDVARAALIGLRPFLTSELGAVSAAELIREFDAARVHRARMAPIDAARTWMRMEELRDDVERAWSVDLPFALDALERGLSKSLFRSDGECRAALEGALERMARRAGRDPAWSTWSDLPSRLRFLVARQRQRDGMARALDEDVCRRVIEALPR